MTTSSPLGHLRARQQKSIKPNDAIFQASGSRFITNSVPTRYSCFPVAQYRAKILINQ